MFCKKGDLENFAKFTEKHLYQSLFFNNVAGLRPCSLKKEGVDINERVDLKMGGQLSTKLQNSS